MALKLSSFAASNSRLLSTLVFAEHDGAKLKPATRHAITAAKKLGGDVTALVAGPKCGDVAKEVAAIDGLSKVLVSESAAFEGFLPERLSPTVLAAQKQTGCTHVLAGASALSVALMHRVAAKLDVSPISDIIGIKDGDTFVRMIYAGNAVMTMKSNDGVKVGTVRTTAWDPEEKAGGSAAVEDLAAADAPQISEFVGQELSKSDRPELSSAKVRGFL